MIAAVSSALTTVIGWVGDVLTAVTTGSLSSLLPLLAIGVFRCLLCWAAFGW